MTDHSNCTSELDLKSKDIRSEDLIAECAGGRCQVCPPSRSGTPSGVYIDSICVLRTCIIACVTSFGSREILFTLTRGIYVEKKTTNPTNKKSATMSQSSQGKSTLSREHQLPVLNSQSSSPKPPSSLSQIRQFMREPMAEFAGVAVFLIIGTGVDCQVVLSTDPAIASSQKGNFLSVNFGWAIGLALGVWVSGGISGGHINPAITLAMATWRGFPWRKVPGYILAQVLGGIFGSAIVYGNYINAINIFEGGNDIRTQATASLFATYALDYLTNISCFFVEFTGTMILALMIVVGSDKYNMAPPQGLLPLIVFLVLLGLGVSHGMQTSYAFNPARDFGPRLLLSFAGYGKQLYTYRDQYWLWCPIIGPILGAQVGIGFYDLFLKQRDSESADSPASHELSSPV